MNWIERQRPQVKPDVLQGIVDRHAHIETAPNSDIRLDRSTRMAYLSHLDRGELLTEIDRLRKDLKLIGELVMGSLTHEQK